MSAQFALWGDNNLRSLSFEVSNLVHASNNYHIAKNQILKGFVRYMMTNELNKDKRGGCGPRSNSAAFDFTLVADPIDHLTQKLEVNNAEYGCRFHRILLQVYSGTVSQK